MYIVCYDNIINIFNPITKKHKFLITYYKIYGIIVVNKHVNAFHSIIAKNFEEEINNEITKIVERQPTKKKTKCPSKCNFYFFCCKRTFQKR
jgi:hypothetical protein